MRDGVEACPGHRTNGGFPSGVYSTIGEQWPIRRYVSEGPGTVTISGHLAKSTAGGDGVVGRILVDGREVYTKTLAGSDTVGVEFAIDALVRTHSTIDFAIDPRATHDFDGTAFQASIVSWGETIPSGVSIDVTLYLY